MGLDRGSKNQVTAEELHLVVAEAQTAGVLEESERALISGIVRLADRPVREVMTPRTEIDWIDLDSTAEEIRQALLETTHSRVPVADGSIENIVGVIQIRDVAAALLEARPLDLKQLCRTAPVIPDLMDAMDALAVLRNADVPLALVHDEYGHLDGIVTPGSLLAALAGTFAHDIEQGEEPPLVERDDGSWLVSGAANADVLSDRLGIRLPDERDYSTVAGFALSVLKHLPETGEKFRHDGWSFEIVDMDGRKIDKLIASRPMKRPSGGGGASSLLELPELLLEAVDIVAGEIFGLFDDPVAVDPSAKRAELIVQAFDLDCSKPGDLPEIVESGSVQSVREFRADTLQLAKVVSRNVALECTMDWSADDVPCEIRRCCRRFAGDAATFAGLGALHMRANGSAVGECHALLGSKQERQRQSDDDCDHPPIFAN